jgi:hypothetical protein
LNKNEPVMPAAAAAAAAAPIIGIMQTCAGLQAHTAGIEKKWNGNRVDIWQG